MPALVLPRWGQLSIVFCNRRRPFMIGSLNSHVNICNSKTTLSLCADGCDIPRKTSAEIADVVACPGCSTSEHVNTGDLGAEVICSIRGRLFIQPAYAVRGCLRCGLLYRTPVLTPEAFADYYRLVD